MYNSNKKSRGISVELNFHAEKHGKSAVDQHFSVISRYIKMGSLKQKLKSVDDVIECIRKASNDNENEKNKIYCLKLINKTRIIKINKRVVKDFKSFYCLINKKNDKNEFVLRTSIFSDKKNNLQELVDANQITTHTKNVEYDGEVNLVDLNINVDLGLAKKKQKIEQLSKNSHIFFYKF